MKLNSSLPVSIHNFKQDWLFTEAFHNPAIPEDDTKHVADNGRLVIDPNEPATNLVGHDAIVIRQILDKTKISWLLIFLLVSSPALGLAVGLCTHKAEVGVAVSAGIFALASFLQGLAAWFHV